MADFLNYNKGVISIDDKQDEETRLTEIDELLADFSEGHREPLSVSLDHFIKSELAKIDLSICDDMESARDYIFGEADFLDLTLSQLNIEISEHPDLRDWQNDFIIDYFTE